MRVSRRIHVRCVRPLPNALYGMWPARQQFIEFTDIPLFESASVTQLSATGNVPSLPCVPLADIPASASSEKPVGVHIRAESDWAGSVSIKNPGFTARNVAVRVDKAVPDTVTARFEETKK